MMLIKNMDNINKQYVSNTKPLSKVEKYDVILIHVIEDIMNLNPLKRVIKFIHLMK